MRLKRWSKATCYRRILPIFGGTRGGAREISLATPCKKVRIELETEGPTTRGFFARCFRGREFRDAGLETRFRWDEQLMEFEDRARSWLAL